MLIIFETMSILCSKTVSPGIYCITISVHYQTERMNHRHITRVPTVLLVDTKPKQYYYMYLCVGILL